MVIAVIFGAGVAIKDVEVRMRCLAPSCADVHGVSCVLDALCQRCYVLWAFKFDDSRSQPHGLNRYIRSNETGLTVSLFSSLPRRVGDA